MKNRLIFSKIANVFILYLEHILSHLIGFFCYCRKPAWFKNGLIRWFIKRYHIDMTEFSKQKPEEYAHFNEFFLRQPKSFKIFQGKPNEIKSPATGVITHIGGLEESVEVKGHRYTAESLLGNHSTDIETFRYGQCVVVYLSPDSYHRVHMPVTGELEYTISIPGFLHSVANADSELLTHNARVASIFKTDDSKKVAVILVGAFFVASMHTVWSKERMTPVAYEKKPKIQYIQDELSKGEKMSLTSGEEMGYFCLGSTVVLLFSSEAPIQWQPNLIGKQVECGEMIGYYPQGLGAS